MKKRFGEYVRLARGAFGCSSFWRAENHFLYVKGSGFLLPFSEEYYRFEFRKIQSIAATRTAGAVIWSVLTGICALVCGLLAAACVMGVDGSESDSVLYFLCGVFVITTLICLATVAANIVLGPTCVVRIQTAVRSERIRSLNRWNTVRPILETMSTTVELAQKEQRVVAAPSAAEPPPVPPVSSELPPAPDSPQPPPVR